MKLLVLDNEDKNIPPSVFVKDPQNYIQVSSKHGRFRSGIYRKRSIPYFFERIVVLDHKNISCEIAHRLFNLLTVPGVIICPNNYKSFFTQGAIESKRDDFIQVTKKNNFLFNIPNWAGDGHKRSAVDFICVGAQRCATTSIINNLGFHPDICKPPGLDPLVSEPHFFDMHWSKGIKYYRDFLKYNKKISGEKTANLLYLSHTYPLIQSINPYVKLIITLRDPIERAISHYKMRRINFNIRESFGELIDTELKFRINEPKTFSTAANHYLQRGLYYQQILNIKKWFPEHNILIIIFEDIKNKPSETYNKICDFLNVKSFKKDTDFQKFNASPKINVDVPDELYDFMVKFFSNDVKKLERLLGRELNWLSPPKKQLLKRKSLKKSSKKKRLN